MVTWSEPVCTADLLAILPAFQTSIIGSDALASKVEQVVLDTLGGMASWSGTLGAHQLESSGWGSPEWAADITKASGEGMSWTFENVYYSSDASNAPKFTMALAPGSYRIVYGGDSYSLCMLGSATIQNGSDSVHQLASQTALTVTGPTSHTGSPSSISIEIAIYKL